jgi:dGTPase
MLKAMTLEYVINNPSLSTQQYGQRQVIRTLFRIFYRATRRKESWNLFPIGYQEELRRVDETGGDVRVGRTRVAVDLIASMTEQQALRMYERVTGHGPGSALDRV